MAQGSRGAPYGLSSPVAAEPAAKSDTMPERHRPGHIYAALDLGTNNCRLLIAKPDQAGFRVLDSFSRTVRLGDRQRMCCRDTGPTVEQNLDLWIDGHVRDSSACIAGCALLLYQISERLTLRGDSQEVGKMIQAGKRDGVCHGFGDWTSRRL